MTNNEYKRLRKGMWIICKDADETDLSENKAYKILSACQSAGGLIVIIDDVADEDVYLSANEVMSCFERNYKFLSKGYILKLLRGL